MKGLVIDELVLAYTPQLVKSYLVTYVKHNYDYEIVTGLYIIDKEYFRFTKLFDSRYERFLLVTHLCTVYF